MTRAAVWLIFAVCCAAPLAWMAAALLTTPEAWRAVFPIQFHLKLLGRTILYNGAVAAVAVGLAIPVAIVIAKGSGVLSRIMRIALPAGLLLPSITYAYGWMQALRITHTYPMPGTFADVARCVWTLATWLWPIPAAVMGWSLRRLDGDLQQQALLDGAYWRLVVRRLIGPALASFALVAVLAMQEFAVYEPTGISVVATEVRTVFETGQPGSVINPIDAVTTGSFPMADQRRNAAAALVTALPLLLVIGALSLAAIKLIRRDESSETIEHGPLPRVLLPGWGVTLTACVVFLLTMVVPLGAMVGSLERSPDLGRIWRTFSPSIIGTLIIGGLTGLAASAIAILETIRPSRWTIGLGLVTFLVGGQILAIAMIRMYNREGLEWVYNGPAIMVLAHLARFAWLAAWAGCSTWNISWRQIRDMSAVDGAGAVATARYVVFPLAWPLVLAAGFLVMLLAMTEVPATILISPMRPEVFVPKLMQWIHQLRRDDMLEGSLLLGGMVIVMTLVIVMLVKLVRAPIRAVAPVFVLLLLVGCDGSSAPDATWLETGAGEGQVVYPRAIAYSKTDDSFFVCDRLARIQHLDKDGKFIHGWRMPQWQIGKPTGLTVGPDGNLWVPDTHYGRVLVFNSEGKQVKELGKPGKGPGEFIFPCDVAFDERGRIFVAEFGDNDRISVFDKDLKYLFSFGKFGEGDGEFSRPQSMVIVGDVIYIADACNHRISVWTTDGRFLRNMGRIGSALGELRFPYGLDVDSKGRLVVCEFGNNRVQLIDKETGKGIRAWGGPGREAGQLAYPWAVAIDEKDRVVAVDAGNNRLQVFRF